MEKRLGSKLSTDIYIHIQFVKDVEGKVNGLILRQRNTRLEARKIE